MVTTIYGIGTADGFNERGLGAHMLYLTATDFGPRDAESPACRPACGRSTRSTMPRP